MTTYHIRLDSALYGLLVGTAESEEVEDLCGKVVRFYTEVDNKEPIWIPLRLLVLPTGKKMWYTDEEIIERYHLYSGEVAYGRE